VHGISFGLLELGVACRDTWSLRVECGENLSVPTTAMGRCASPSRFPIRCLHYTIPNRSDRISIERAPLGRGNRCVEAIAHAVHGGNTVAGRLCRGELAANVLDMRVDCPVTDVAQIRVRIVEQLRS